MSGALFKVMPHGSVISENPYCLRARQPLPISQWMTHLLKSMCSMRQAVSQFNSPESTFNSCSSIIYIHNAYWCFEQHICFTTLPPGSAAAWHSPLNLWTAWGHRQITFALSIHLSHDSYCHRTSLQRVEGVCRHMHAQSIYSWGDGFYPLSLSQS